MNYSAYEPQSTRRLHVLARVLYAIALIIFGRLIYLQVFKHTELHEMAIRQQEQEVDLREMRGTIFDADQKPLAISVPVDSVCVNPRRIKDPGFAAAVLAGALKLNEADLRERITASKEANGGFLWIKRKLSPDESETLHMLRDVRRENKIDSGAGLDWIEFRTESKRVYPNGPLAGSVIGWLNERDHGAGGLEQTLEKDLDSVHGAARMIKDVRPTEGGGGFGSTVSHAAIPGKNIVITIDARIQYVAEQSLARAVERTHAGRGAVVVMDPKNGHILAMASYPGFDPNDVPEDPELRKNRAIGSSYEPGSAFKVVTYSAVFEHTNWSPMTPINCGGGSLALFGHTFHDTHSYSVIPLEDAFAHSSNVGAIVAAKQAGEDALHDMISRFQFGEKTGIPLAGEESGYVRPFDKWKKITLASAAIGYGLRTTTLQLARAAAVIANGGSLVTPQLLVSTQRPGGPVENVKMPEPVRIMRPETAITMRRMMERVILLGTGRKAFLKVYTAGGKTGSSKTTETIETSFKKPDGTVVKRKKTVYTASTYNGTFYGMAPLVDPSIVIAVTVNGGHGNEGFGGEAAAPVFKEVALAALRLRDVPKDVPLESPASGSDTNDLAIAALDPPPGNDDDDFAFASVPSPQTSTAAAQTAASGGLRPFLKPPSQKVDVEDVDPDVPVREVATGPVVPDFQGKTLRAVLEQASGLGLEIEPLGRGVARSQVPAPGQRIGQGEKVKVQFAR
jgi:cell division protein FtsI (penicillin-binding protein 3)